MPNKPLVPYRPHVIGIAAALAAGLAATAQAQPSYPGYYSYYPAPAAAPSWNYDPYTSGLGPCPQRKAGDPQCRYTVNPTFGQPDFWPNH